MPDCTVVVIAYNDAARLPRAVRSVLGQTLRNLQVIIVDDGSTDRTPEVIAELCAQDNRVRAIRRPINSGGCGAPRNDGLAAVTTPYVMFLDSDDTLPPHACKSLLMEIERTGSDFVTGQMARLHEGSGRRHLYYPHLYRRRILNGVREDPEMFLDSFATNKLYRAGFLRRHRLWFDEDVHFEDHVFSARLLCATRRFAVVPWVVYEWRRAAERPGTRTSISRSVREMDNVRHRLRAARLSDAVLRETGHADLLPARHHRFLRQDLRVYLGPLPALDRVWIKEFAALVRPYLEEIRAVDPEVFERVDPMTKVCAHLIMADRVEELEVAARSLGGVAPRRVVRENGRTYWGDTPEPGMDITRLRMAELPFTASRLRHEITEMSVTGTTLTLSLRTYDPFGVLDRNPGCVLELRLRGQRVRLTPHRRDDALHSEASVDLAATVPERLGFAGRDYPIVVAVRPDGRTTRDRLLVSPTTPPVTVAIPGHQVTVGPEGAAAVLRVRWQREGLLRHAPRLLDLRKKVVKRLGSPALKLKAYKVLIRVVPRRPDLALFEADVGKGYTGNPRYIYEELRRRDLPIHAVWSMAPGRPRRHGPPPGTPRVRRMSWRYVWTLARAAYWVDSHGLPLDFPKPRGTRYLQTWHGQGIKSIGYDAPDLRGDFSGPREQWRAAVARWDALVSPSAEFERIFLPANGYTGRVLRFGSPRCDVLVRGDEDRLAAARVRERLEIPDDRGILLYAPTYRDSAKYSGRSVRADLTEMAEALADRWVLVLRTHPVERYRVPPHLRYFVRHAGSYPEINDLLLASDALITDYSSLMCDYAVTGKPMLFLIDDWDDYRHRERGVQHDLPAIAPGPCVTTTAELIDAVRDLDRVREAYADRYAAFRRMWCADERGEAAARVVDAFFARPATRRAAPAAVGALAATVAGRFGPWRSR